MDKNEKENRNFNLFLWHQPSHTQIVKTNSDFFSFSIKQVSSAKGSQKSNCVATAE